MSRKVQRDMAPMSPLRRARRVARDLADRTVEVSSPLRTLPDFLIVGAQRCGTTSMFKTLIQHPDVARPFLRKGVHYFDTGYDHGPAWYRGHFPIGFTSRLRRFGRRTPLTGESSPFYMFHPLAAERIAGDLPQVRVIALLRDPVERAYSAHSHETARGFETLPFEEALAREPERLEGERERMTANPHYVSYDLQHHAYRSRGEYVGQLERLSAALGRDRVFVVDSDDFFHTPEPVMPPLLDFLGLRQYDGFRFEQHNARSRSKMDEAIRERLDAHFAPFDDELARWWERTPSWRR